MSRTNAIAQKLDGPAEQVRRNMDQRIKELQDGPASGMGIIRDVELANGIDTPVSHGKGRAVSVWVSAVRGASTSGRIDETRSALFDRSKVVVLQANGWGATITVDIMVA